MMPDFPDLIREMNTRKEFVRHYDRQAMYYYKTLRNTSKAMGESVPFKNRSNTSFAEQDMDKSTVTEKQSMMKSKGSNLSIINSIRSAK